MKISIRNVSNGYVVDVEGEEVETFVCETSNEVWQEEKFKTKDSDNIALGKMLEYVAQFSNGYTYDKWNNSNLKISFDGEGHKYEKPV